MVVETVQHRKQRWDRNGLVTALERVGYWLRSMPPAEREATAQAASARGDPQFGRQEGTASSLSVTAAMEDHSRSGWQQVSIKPFSLVQEQKAT